MPSQQRIETLTPRQREILELVAQGLTNDDIGGALAISPGTVRVHLSAILAALEVGNRTEAARVYHASVAEPARVAAVLERPAIAVLPLRALDDDARARTIAAAISDDLAGLFARACWFPVIAQASSAGARALGATSQAMAQALGARFLVDGTLRMGQGGWRVTVEVVDGQGGHCLWTERFDFAQSELFEVQDTVCATIVATAYPVMMTRVQMGLRQAPRPQDLEAWELAHRAMELAARRDHAAATQAREHFALAVRREPTLVLAHYGMGLGAYDDVLNQWGPDELARERLLAAATRCIELAPHAGEGYFLQARYFQTRGDHARAVPALEAAIAHNPSFAQAHALLAQTLQITDRSEEAMLRMKQALRLGPRAFVAGLALLHFMRGELALALDAAEHAVSINPRYTFARVMAATSAHFLGEVARAGEHVQRLRQDYPAFVPARLLRVFGPEVDVVRRISVGLEALGVSE